MLPLRIQHDRAVIKGDFLGDFLGMSAENDTCAAAFLAAFSIFFGLMDDFQ